MWYYRKGGEKVKVMWVYVRVSTQRTWKYSSLTLREPKLLFTFLILFSPGTYWSSPESMHCWWCCRFSSAEAWSELSEKSGQMDPESETNSSPSWKTFQWNVWSSRNITQISAIKLKLFRDSKQRTPFHLDKNTSNKNLHYKSGTSTLKHLTKSWKCILFCILIRSVYL